MNKLNYVESIEVETTKENALFVFNHSPFAIKYSGSNEVRISYGQLLRFLDNKDNVRPLNSEFQIYLIKLLKDIKKLKRSLPTTATIYLQYLAGE